MELEIIENNFIAENIEKFLTAEKFDEFKNQLQTLATVTFEKNELGRKEARSMSRKVGTLKTKITERFDDLIKSEKAKNDEFVKYLKTLTTTKAKYLAECEDLQSILKQDVSAFDAKIQRQFEAMQATVRQYQNLDDLKKAKEALINAYDINWEEKRKDADKLFSDLNDRLIMQEATIAQLEKERAERQRIEAEREQERLVREREAQERLIHEQAERVAQGKAIELPLIPTPASISAPTLVAIPTPQQQSYVLQKPAEPEPQEKYTLFFDTETTSPIPTQARIVQIGALVFNEDGKEIDRLNILVKQDAPIPHETIAIHGKTDAMCAEQGVLLAEALQRFKDLYDNCNFIVAHNIQYDETVIKSEFGRIGQSFEITKPKFDTMVLYKDIVKCPPTEKMLKAGFTAYKNPKLDETYEFVFGKGFDNAHDALSDVSATAELYHHFQSVNRKVVQIMVTNGISRDQARLIARMLSKEDLTNYRAF